MPCVLYKGFPRTVDMDMGLCRFINNFETPNWTDAIVETKDNKGTVACDSIASAIKAKGFDAKGNARRVCEMYKLML